MSKFLLIQVMLLFFTHDYAQELPAEQMEQLAEREEAEMDDDSRQLDLEYFRKHKMNINNAAEEELSQLVTSFQALQLVSYRKIFGDLVSIYELQAVPGWDIETARRVVPYIIINHVNELVTELANLEKGEHTIELRSSMVMERSRGYSNGYAGSPFAVFFRYRYNYKSRIMFGVTAEKDAGERFFSKGRSLPDFSSIHVFIRDIGFIKSVALGDYTVNLGQGLVHWQSMSFGKGSGVAGIKKQSPVIKPYRSGGEYNFFRGVAITIGKRNIESELFVSVRKLTANKIYDSVLKREFISSMNTSGYHRTENELSDRDALKQYTAGGNFLIRKKQLSIGVSSIAFLFSVPWRVDEIYSMNGKTWINHGIHYSCTWKNMHLFGEVAVDKRMQSAVINGMMISLDPTVDIAILHRWIGKGYQAVNASAFTEAAKPSNEHGCYINVQARPFPKIQVEGYVDLFIHPWLRFGVDRPSTGSDLSIQVIYTPNKRTELYSRYRVLNKERNDPVGDAVTNEVILFTKKNWRIHWQHVLTRAITIRGRIEMVWYGGKDKGVLSFFDILYSSADKPWSANLRYQLFDTDSYNSRIYAFESDVLSFYSIPAFADRGSHYYINIKYRLGRSISLWFKWSSSKFLETTSVGSGLDEIAGNVRSTVRGMCRIIF